MWANRTREGGKLEQTATCQLPVTLADDVETNKVEILVTRYKNHIIFCDLTPHIECSKGWLIEVQTLKELLKRWPLLCLVMKIPVAFIPTHMNDP